MRRSEGEKQGVGPEEGKKKKQTEDEQKERRNGRNRSNEGSNDKFARLFWYCWLL